MRATVWVAGLLAAAAVLLVSTMPAWSAGPAGVQLTLEAPGRGWTGDTMFLTTHLQDGNGNPVPGAKVQLFREASFMPESASDPQLVSLGDAATDAKGVATFEFMPRSSGRVRLLARVDSGAAQLETSVEVLIQSSQPLYRPEIGIHLPSLGPEIAPASTQVSLNAAPGTVLALRLPGGTTSWLLLLVGVVATLWAIYLFVMYQVMRISLE